MSLEYENSTVVFGKYGDVCQGPQLDWRMKCKDEIILNTPIVFTDLFWKNLPYEAIIKDSSTINFRQPNLMEGGSGDDACKPSTANVSTELCDFVLPNLQHIRIGTGREDYMQMRDKFCEKFPQFNGFSPFDKVGNTVVFRKGDNSEAMLTFAGEKAGELSFASWEHLTRTYWVGEKENVDEFDGFFDILSTGLTEQVVGTCDYPLTPTTINIAEYIIGITAVAAGSTVGPGDIVLAPTDPDYPTGDTPNANNIVTIHAGTQYETTLDITGFDTVDLLTEWYRYITEEWGVAVFTWLTGIGKGQTKCIAEVAACKRACQGQDCRQLLVSDNRDMARSERQARYVNRKEIELWPYDPTFPLIQSPALKQRNEILFMPWEFEMNGDRANSLLWVFRDQQSSNKGLLRDVPPMRSEILRGNMPSTPLHNLQEFPDLGEAFENRAFDWLMEKFYNCFEWWLNSEQLLLPQAPHLWLYIQGVDCSQVLVRPCNNPGRQEAILTCSATTPNSVFRVTIDNAGGDFNCAVGSKVRIVSANGNTNLQGEITTIHDDTDPVDISITLDELGPYADCTWDGTALDAGGKILYNLC